MRHLGLLLRGIGDATVADSLRNVLSADTPEHRAEAIRTIAKLAPQPMPQAHYAASALLELGPEAAPALREWVLAHGDDACPVLFATLDDPVDPSPGLSAFEALLDHSDDAIVAVAAAAVGRVGAGAAGCAPRLRELLRTRPDTWLRSHSLEALGRIGAADAESLELLTGAVVEGEEDEPLHAIVGLGFLDSAAAGAVELLCGRLGHDDVRIANAAATSLRRIGVRDASVGDALARALAGEEDPDCCLPLLHAIGELKAPSPEARAALDEALGSGDGPKHAGAAVAIYLADGRPEPLRELLSRPDECDDVLFVLADWGVEPAPFRDELARLIPECRGDGLAALLHLIRHLGDEGRECIPALEEIAADERAHPWNRDVARNVLEHLRG